MDTLDEQDRFRNGNLIPELDLDAVRQKIGDNIVELPIKPVDENVVSINGIATVIQFPNSFE